MGSIVLPPGATHTFIAKLLEWGTPASSPPTGYTVKLAVRRGSDDKWYDFIAGAWDVVADYASLGAEHLQTMADKSDGTYEYDWNPSVTDTGLPEVYEAVMLPTSVGTFQNKFGYETLVYTYAVTASASGARTVTFTVEDGGGTPLQGVQIAVRASSGGANIRPGVVTGALGTAITGLDDGTYYVQALLNGYTHTEETLVVDSNETPTLTMTAAVIGAPVSPSARRVYAYPWQISGSLSTDSDSPLFSVHLNKPARRGDGVIVNDWLYATYDSDNDLWYVDVSVLDTMTAMDGTANSTLTYIWEFVNRTQIQKRVDTADSTPANLISDLD